MKKGLLAVGLATSLLCINSYAESLDLDTGSDLLARCNLLLADLDRTSGRPSISVEDFYLKGQCVGFVKGTARLLQLTKVICLPTKVSDAEIIRVVVNYGKNYPKVLHQSSVNMALYGLGDAYPCSNGEAK